MFKTIRQYAFIMPGPDLRCAEVKEEPELLRWGLRVEIPRIVNIRVDLDLE